MADTDRPTESGKDARKDALSAEPTLSPLANEGDLAFSSGQTLGNFEIVRLLGRGGFGEVWEAKDLVNGRRLALKVITTARSTSQESLQRFLKEGRLAASIIHPRSICVFGAEVIDGFPVIVQELMPRGTLQDRLKSEGPMTFDEAVDALLDIIDGLEAAQQAGVLHRDIKPSNCFVGEDGRIKIGDYGLSESLEISKQGQDSRRFAGTPAYCSPEQAEAGELDVRTDIYSAGATMYSLLTGNPPFGGHTPREILAKVREDLPDFAPLRAADVPRGLIKALQKCLAKDRDQRYRGYSELRESILPYSSRGLRTGELPERFGAFLIDWILSKPLWLLFGMAGMWSSWLPFGLAGEGSSRIWADITLAISMMAYFVISEASWGGSPGKLLLGLRVTSASGNRTGLGRIVTRNILFILLYQSVTVTVRAATAMPTVEYSSHLWISVLEYSGLLLMLSTMRRRNGFAGLHETLSGTRVMSIKRRRIPAVPDVALRPTSHAAVKTVGRRKFGPYSEIGFIWKRENDELVLAHDVVLQRDVWIHRQSDPAITKSPGDLAAYRPGRLHWLQGSRVEDECWDAYEIPRGQSLLQWTSMHSSANWTLAARIIHGLLLELKHGQHGRELPHDVSVAHLWLDSDAQPRVLEFPTELSLPETYYAHGAPDERTLLTQTMDLFLMGAVPGAKGRKAAGTKIPEGARKLIERMVSTAETSLSLEEITAGFSAFVNQPSAVGRWQRLAPVGLTLVYPLLYASIGVPMFLGGAGPESLKNIFFTDFVGAHRMLSTNNLKEDQETGRALDLVIALSFIRLDGVGVDPRESLSAEKVLFIDRALARFPQPHEEDIDAARELVKRRLSGYFHEPGRTISSVAVVSSAIVMAPLMRLAYPAVILSFVFRGPPLFLLFRIAVQKKDGRRASRMRCFWRSIVAWSPMLIGNLVWVLFPMQDSGTILTVALSPFYPTLISVALASTIISILNPERGLQDVIAGTRLVRR